MSSAASIKGEIRNLKAKLKTYKNRKKSLESIYRSAPGKFSGAASAVSMKISGCAENTHSALAGNRNTATLGGCIRSYRQPEYSGDPKLSPAVGKVSQEINRCTNKISEIERKIKNLETQLKNLDK